MLQEQIGTQQQPMAATSDRDDMDARQIAERAMGVAAEICVYTNSNLTIEAL